MNKKTKLLLFELLFLKIKTIIMEDDSSSWESFSDSESENLICTHCGKELGDEFLECGKCQSFRFCDQQCSDAIAEDHKRVCYNVHSTDPHYLNRQLDAISIDEEYSELDELQDILEDEVHDSIDLEIAQQLIEEHLFLPIAKRPLK